MTSTTSSTVMRPSSLPSAETTARRHEVARLEQLRRPRRAGMSGGIGAASGSILRVHGAIRDPRSAGASGTARRGSGRGDSRRTGGRSAPAARRACAGSAARPRACTSGRTVTVSVFMRPPAVSRRILEHAREALAVLLVHRAQDLRGSRPRAVRRAGPRGRPSSRPSVAATSSSGSMPLEEFAAHFLVELDQHVALDAGFDELPDEQARARRQRLEQRARLRPGADAADHAVGAPQAARRGLSWIAAKSRAAIVACGRAFRSLRQRVVAHEELRIFLAEMPARAARRGRPSGAGRRCSRSRS